MGFVNNVFNYHGDAYTRKSARVKNFFVYVLIK